MSEDFPNKPDTQSERMSIVTKMVQNPLWYLTENKSKGCRAALNFLLELRSEIKRNESYRIEGPDVDFAQYYRSDNGTVEHYEALFTLLQRAGYDRLEIESALMELLPAGFEGNPDSKSEAVKKYLALTQEALGKVFTHVQ